MNIFIPIGGKGERFKQDNYKFPKPLINVLGKPLILWVLDNLNISSEDKIFIVYNSELEDYNFSDIIRFKYKHQSQISFIKLSYFTRGAAETLLCGLNTLQSDDLENLTLSIDCDTFYLDDIINNAKTINDSSIFYFLDNTDKAIYSYIEINNNLVTNIKEKIKISNFANCGAYCFKTGTILKTYCEELTTTQLDTTNKEYYLSSIYYKMLNNNEKVIPIKFDNFNCLGTPEQVKLFCLEHKSTPKRFCFDLDNTLVSYPTNPGDYTTVNPILRNINYVKFLKQLGHTIIIYTARRMKTHNGNVGCIMADVGKITIETLNKYNIPYDELYFGKPYADFYIDDLAINPYIHMEKDIGFYNTSIKSREFNNIEIKQNSIIKTSEKDISGEIYWYKNIPLSISNLFPTLLHSSTTSLEIELIDGIPLSLLYINNALTCNTLLSVLSTIEKLHTSCQIPENVIFDLNDCYANKIISRYTDYDFSKFSNNEVIVSQLITYLNGYIKNNRFTLSVIHGDPVFTNILLQKNCDLKFIDMRGKIGNVLTIYGDKNYDFAKIYQSLLGYDFILNNILPKKEYINELKMCFEDYIVTTYNKQTLCDIKVICNSLLYTLIPLHNNDKCEQYFNLINMDEI